jgi:anti-sigma regulatory factor (Ser/Thr protein kinase)
VRHGSPEADGNIGLRLEGDQDALRVVVTDGGEDFAFDPGSVEGARNGHFGLLFVDRLADRWGLRWTARRPFGWRFTPPKLFDTAFCPGPQAKLSV